MKAQLYSKDGKKKSDIELPKIFSSKIRRDIVAKYFEAQKYWEMQPYSPDEKAGRKHAASGKIVHQRHRHGGHYGKGISRLPRKTMWRRGTQFYWIGAEVSQARGGRKPHAPKGFYSERKINKKEVQQAINSAMAATFNPEFISERYATLSSPTNSQVIESLPSKTKEAIAALKEIFGSAFSLVMKKKSVRAGKGKARGRKYKSNAGLLVVTGSDEKVKLSGVEVVPYKELSIFEINPLGRLTLYTKKAIEEIEKNGGRNDVA